MTHLSKVRNLLIGCGVLATAAFNGLVASAAEQFNNQTIQFDRDTIIEFEFQGANNAAKSTFGVLNLATNQETDLISEVRAQDKPGRNRVSSTGKAVKKPYAEYTFKAGTPYSLYLKSSVNGQPPVTVYSTLEKNGGSRVAAFENDATALGTQGVRIGWNDGVSPASNGFNQFVVIAGGGVGCPCKPSAILSRPIPPETTPTKGRAPRAKG
jgi:phosphotransferase system HPr-like phosphotransfer protein